jgi:Holliday junction resolvase RusA-like endonuclease
MKIYKKIKTLSINKAFQGRRFKTAEYKAYEEELLYNLPACLSFPNAPYSFSFEFGFSNKASDIDNPVKILVDIMQKKYGFNDKEIYHMTLEKKIVSKGEEYFKLEIKTL